MKEFLIENLKRFCIGLLFMLGAATFGAVMLGVSVGLRYHPITMTLIALPFVAWLCGYLWDN